MRETGTNYRGTQKTADGHTFNLEQWKEHPEANVKIFATV
jgi:hypothetical protein